jgi:hypothetical protein
MEEAIAGLIQLWKKNNIPGIYCENKQQALKKIMEMIPDTASVGFSGSETLGQLDVLQALSSRGNKIFDQNKPSISREESLEIRRQGVNADYYLASANAIAKTGELVFFSAFGNRTAGVSYARNVIVVCGINKLTENLEEGLKRAREYATPFNCKRLNWNSACFKEGVCSKEICYLPEYRRMCCQILIIEAEAVPDRLKVVLVGESLGY